MTTVGKSPKAAEYAGIKIGRTVILAMAISGAMGGLAGVTHFMANVPSIAPNLLPPLGFDAIAVALLGNVHPLGAILGATLITTLTTGATYMSSIVGVRQEIAAVITGLILLFTACAGYLRVWVENKKRLIADAAEAARKAADTEGGADPVAGDVAAKGGDGA